MNEIDVHGMMENEAKKRIEQYIASLPESVKQITIIHGYHGGTVLKDLVRDRFKIRSKRIKRKRFTMNQGETIYELY